MMKISEMLKEAKLLIEKPENWIKGDLARNNRGQRVSPILENCPVKFCAVGAIRYICTKLDMFDDKKYYEAFDYLQNNCPYPLIFFNDLYSTQHCDILNFYHQAITQAEKDEVSK